MHLEYELQAKKSAINVPESLSLMRMDAVLSHLDQKGKGSRENGFREDVVGSTIYNT